MDTDINEIVSKIRKLKSLKPSTEVNKVFSKLVSIALSSKAKINLGSNDINFIQRSAAIAEYELEKYWVKRIIKGINGITSKINNLNSRLIRYKILGEVNDKNDLKTKIKLLERLQSRISDEMSFKDPII